MQHVTFEGYCHGEELKDLFRNAAFLVIPSECYENAPMSILEAYAYGKPVIGSDLGGTPELVSNNQTGMLVPAGDVRALAEAMATLWHNHKLLEDMGRAARARVEADFSSERHADRLSEIYRNLIH
jgi:glycosyltransferase involved in cell wall biosynthesis